MPLCPFPVGSGDPRGRSPARPCAFCAPFQGNSPYYYDSGRGSQIAITQKVISGVYPGVTTNELDTLAAETAAALTIKHPDYAILGARIAVSNLHKETKKDFSGSCDSRGLFAYPAGRPMPRTAREHTERAVQAGGSGGRGGRAGRNSPGLILWLVRSANRVALLASGAAI